jgi:hypothetical protein
MPALVEELAAIISPEESAKVFVALSAYNSTNYYVQGDVLTPGKIPNTGGETVLDAIQYAGGFLPTADSADIRLVRPGRGGKPAKVYKVDLAAIRDRGDVAANYQIFPGDRLIVGRNATVQKTVELDRLAAPINAVTAAIQQEANALRALQLAGGENSEKLLKDLVDFWANRAAGSGDSAFDAQTLREILMRRLAPLPSAGGSASPK